MELHTTMRLDSSRVARRIVWTAIVGAMVVAGYFAYAPAPVGAGHDVAPLEASATSTDDRRGDTSWFVPAEQGASVDARQSAAALPLRLYPELAKDAIQDDGRPPSF